MLKDKLNGFKELFGNHFHEELTDINPDNYADFSGESFEEGFQTLELKEKPQRIKIGEKLEGEIKKYLVMECPNDKFNPNSKSEVKLIELDIYNKKGKYKKTVIISRYNDQVCLTRMRKRAYHTDEGNKVYGLQPKRKTIKLDIASNLEKTLLSA